VWKVRGSEGLCSCKSWSPKMQEARFNLKSLYTLSHRIVLRLHDRVLSFMLLLLLFIKSQKLFSNPNVHLFPFLKLYQCNTGYPVDPFNMLSPLINFHILFPIFGKLFIVIWYFLLPTSYFKYLSV
uniref:Uncharacterized protein n=1 Tax=Theropithecus gelada TaxID=9565 RepID=A0A8D2F5Y7_THEGE